ncbi:MAG: DUF3662 and FHA domain-containing protein [Candidatus Nanopelagicales bacterium]|nr:DUF3662 and FHA domain-containing protein [Candidatus Nanopelagicales bacterium]MDZ4248763.1 DUF3662 and FHA domain-containing protein [Candidatus Nanopelagicales bacterium]MDZ7577139.1 DUF3662 and FHA domain-containing protein [Candidatus Nanopelagicales bacterium]
MGLLESFEQRLDQMVNGTFAKAFPDVVEPVELATGIQKEMDTRAAIVGRGRTVVPNVFNIDLATEDLARLDVLTDEMRAELALVARQYAAEQRYTFLGAVDVRFREESSLTKGVFRIHSQAEADAGEAPKPQPPITPRDATGHPRLVIGTASYPLTRSHTRIGRGTGADIQIDDTGVSRAHAEIILGLPVIIRDLGSTNGTLVDGRSVAESPLHNGAHIQVGSTVITYREM